MSILDTNIVDVIGIDAPNRVTRLGISDHPKWDEGEHEHIVLLQDKINTYLMYLESGQVYENNPNTRDSRFEIELVAKYELSAAALRLFKQAQSIVRGAGFDLSYRIPPANSA